MIVLDEFGNGTVDGAPLVSFPVGFPFGEVYAIPTGIVPGSIVLTDPESPTVAGDYLLFFPVANSFSVVTFGSDSAELGETGVPADVFPPGLPVSAFTNFFPPTLVLPEAGSETNNGLIYTPGPNDPGYFSTPTGGPTYVFISDGTGPPTVTPEPSSLALLALGGVALAGWRRWKKRQVTA